MIVYKVTNLINNKIYIGKSKYNKDSYLGSGYLIKKALNKYGKHNFKKEILFEGEDVNQINEKEKFYINLFNSQNHNIGYNIADGGEGAINGISNHPNREQIIANRTGKKNAFYGKHHTDQTKQKISKSKKGKKVHTEKSKQQISQTLKRLYKEGKITQTISEEERQKRSKRMKENNPYYNDEIKQKLSKTISGSGNPCAKLWIFENINGKKIEIKGNFHQFCRDNDLSIKAMRNIADNKRKNKYYNGWTVQRKEE